MPTYPLRESASVTIGPDGTGTAYAGPARHGEQWSITGVNVTCSGTSTPLASVYLDSPSDGSKLGATRSGNQDTTDLPGIPLFPGNTLVIVWSGAGAGDQATATIVGTRQIADAPGARSVLDALR